MSEMHSGPAVRFLCDQNLGRLAKWLRILGFDTEYMARWDDTRVKDALSSGRIVLTKKQKAATVSGMVIIRRDRLREQILELSALYDIGNAGSPFTRCSLCNTYLTAVSHDDVMGCVPEYVYATQDVFARCTTCRRIYWKGTHFKHAQELIESLLAPGGNI
jgi:uncharacterized protein with PIN domain